MSVGTDERIVRVGGDDEAWSGMIARRPSGLVLERAPSVARIEEAAANGVREILVWLHGARREPHDWREGEGSFDATWNAIGAAREHRIAVAVATLVTRSNARVLIELPARLKPAGVALWVLAWPRATEDGFTSVVARLGLGVPPALAALDRARRIGLDARTIGFPLCTLGPYASFALPSPARSYAHRCASCAARASCPGADAIYVERFGEGELHPLDSQVASAPPPRLARLAEVLVRDP